MGLGFRGRRISGRGGENLHRSRPSEVRNLAATVALLTSRTACLRIPLPDAVSSRVDAGLQSRPRAACDLSGRPLLLGTSASRHHMAVRASGAGGGGAVVVEAEQ